MPAGDITKIIKIIIDTQVRKAGFGTFKRVTDKARKSMLKLSKDSNIPLNQMASRLGAVNLAMRKNGKLYDVLTKKNVVQRQAVNRLNATNARFHMELLSVMFAGMALQRTMSMLLQSTREMTGETEIMGTALGVFFLPYALDSLQVTLGLQKAMFDLNKITGGAAGRIMGWGAATAEATGAGIMWVGQIGLAINGFSLLNQKLKVAAQSSATLNSILMALPLLLKIGIIIGAVWALGVGGRALLDWIRKESPEVDFMINTVVNIERRVKDITAEVTGLPPPVAGAGIDLLETFGAFAGFAGTIGTGLLSLGKFIGRFVPWEGQHGGIVTRPTLGMIGEAGPEAVIPLNRANEYLNFSPTINITATSNVDIGLMKSQLTDEWYSELKSGGLR